MRARTGRGRDEAGSRAQGRSIRSARCCRSWRRLGTIRSRGCCNVDLIAVLVAVLLPWSTSGVGIGMVLWLAALAATLELRPFLRSLQRPICALPIALVALAALGTLWSDAPWGARLLAFSPATKLLVLPFLFYHFERSERGMWVFVAFLASCTLADGRCPGSSLFDPSLSLKLPGEPTGAVSSSRTTSPRARNSCCARSCWLIPIVTLLREGKIWQALLLTADRGELRRQHGVRRRVAHGTGDAAGDARRVRDGCT